MTTAQDLINLALWDLGQYAPNETPSSADSALGLVKLNNMLDSWSNEKLACFADLEQSLSLLVGVSQYPLGAGSLYSTVRPLAITTGPGAAYVQDSLGNNFDVNVVERAEWNQIGTRTVTANIPDTIFYDPQFPQGILNVDPVPNMAGYTLYFDSRLPLGNFSSLATVVSLPAGYVAAIEYNLALELMPAFGIDPDDKSNKAIVALASKHKGNIKRTNTKLFPVNYDPELVAKSGSTYNVYSDRNN